MVNPGKACYNNNRPARACFEKRKIAAEKRRLRFFRQAPYVRGRRPRIRHTRRAARFYAGHGRRVWVICGWVQKYAAF
ncbi:hypothetical protein D3Z39_11675 [Anaerotruncus colihominis]|uniref:Uncharacterized protein n=1 Tax=Anaerotruncus colihominis TaxID=169435 RepID=A0A845RIF2_9FIRM|nr:hypothetical protein [Anaerotruncus colihominis]